MMDVMARVSKVKIPEEIENMRCASHFVEFSLKRLIKEVEDNIDGAIYSKHSKLATIIERIVDIPDRVNQFNQKYGYTVDPESQLFDFPAPILI